MDNMEFRYFYRDGGNYKKWGSVVFANPEKMTEEVVSNAIARILLPDGLFISKQIRVPDVFLYGAGNFSSDDHCYQEFACISSTAKSVTDPLNRSVGEFVEEIAEQAQRGWREFDPYNSVGSYGWFLTSPEL